MGDLQRFVGWMGSRAGVLAACVLLAATSSVGAQPAPDGAYVGIHLHVVNESMQDHFVYRFYIYDCNHFSQLTSFHMGEEKLVRIDACRTLAVDMVDVIVEAFDTRVKDHDGHVDARVCVPSGGLGGPASVRVRMTEDAAEGVQITCD